MRWRFVALTAAAFAVAGFTALASAAEPKAPAALAGKVSSAQEGAMEGVVVSAKKGIVTVSVVSDDKGQFSFPASKLAAGDYALSIRAAGYDLEGPKAVTLAAGKPAEIDLKLVKTKNLAAQLTNLEWMLSVPGGDDQKRSLTGCTNCHSVERILNSSYNAEEFVDVMKRMATYSNNSFFMKPQIRQAARELDRFVPNAERVAGYFASINRSTGERKWDLKTMPRVSGAGTHVVITEYDLPDPTIQPHDVMVDADGIVWHSDFSGQILGRFDPKTLQHKAFEVPMQRAGWPTGALDLEVDPHGDLWLGLMFQAGAAKFDKKTEKFQMIQLPADVLKADSQQAMVGVQNWTVDNTVWQQDPSVPGIYKMNMTTGETAASRPTASSPTSRTTSGSSTSGSRTSARSTPRPARSRSIRPRPSARARAAAASTIRAASGSASSPASASACSTPTPRNSRNGRCRDGSSRPMTPPPTRPATSGPPA